MRFGQIEGAYSLVCLSAKKMIGCRDPLGVRPLVLGDLDGAPILASETCALDIIGADFVRDVEPGEMVIITADGIESLRPFEPFDPRFCIFEYVYFARPDSIVEGRGVYEVRKRIGAELAREAPAAADLVVPVPDSGTPAAIGFAEVAGLPFDLGIIRNHYVGRTFIEPTDAIRHMGVKPEAQRQSQRARRQAGGAGRRFDRARHDVAEDRPDGARGRRQRGAHAHRQPADRPFLLLRRRHAGEVEAHRLAHVG